MLLRLRNGGILLLAFVWLGAASCQEQVTSVANTSSNSTSPNKTTDFDASKAFEHVKNLVALGPRPAGSDAIKKAQDYIKGELASYGLKVIEDDFKGETPRGPIPMKNIIGELAAALPDIVVIAGHYDTKPQPGFVGANDGGSSAAAVLEMARVLAKTKPEYTLWFVFFDGEEAIIDWNANNGTDNTYGSRHLVSRLKSEGKLSRVKAMVLVDMIGDRNLDIKRDLESTPWLVDVIWSTARQMGYGRYFLGNQTAVSDDHVPFKLAGIPAVDIIDFNYGPDNSYWHTNEDTLDKISGESMKVVGDTVIRSLPEIFKQIGVRHLGNG
jgi:glutaminyl-peptide cyclotransferase